METEGDVMSENLEAFGDKVLIEVSSAPKRTAGGIVLPDIVVGDFEDGQIVSAGSDCKHLNSSHRVMFSSRIGFRFSRNGSTYVSMREQDVIAKVF